MWAVPPVLRRRAYSDVIFGQAGRVRQTWFEMFFIGGEGGGALLGATIGVFGVKRGGALARWGKLKLSEDLLKFFVGILRGF